MSKPAALPEGPPIPLEATGGAGSPPSNGGGAIDPGRRVELSRAGGMETSPEVGGKAAMVVGGRGGAEESTGLAGGKELLAIGGNDISPPGGGGKAEPLSTGGKAAVVSAVGGAGKDISEPGNGGGRTHYQPEATHSWKRSWAVAEASYPLPGREER